VISGRRLAAVARKEFIQLFRDRRMLPMLFIAPVVQLAMLGYAANYDLTAVTLGVVDQDHSPLSRRLIDALDQSQTFEITEYDRPDALESGLVSGRIEAALEIPPDLTRTVESGDRASMALLLDGSNSNRALATRGQIEAIVLREALPLNDLVLRQRGLEGIEVKPPVTVVPKIRFNPTLESRVFMVPGVLAMVLTIITTTLTAMAIVKERERGTIEQIGVTPIRASEWILGKMAPFIVVALVDVVLVTGVALFWFHVPLRGSFLLLTFLSMCYITTTLGLGLLISSLSSTQQQAMLTALMMLLPINLLSGIFYPIENMPQAIRGFSLLMPLRFFGIALRSVFLKGGDLRSLWDEAAAMLAIGIVTLFFAVMRSRRGFR
jgi:ABC-2 type transport system permease protein